MVVGFHKVAQWLAKIKWLIVFLLLGSFAGFFGLLAFAEIKTQDLYLAPCLFVFMWALLMMLFIASFIDISYFEQSNTTFLKRLINAFKKLWAYLVVVTTIFLTLTVIYISIKLVQLTL